MFSSSPRFLDKGSNLKKKYIKMNVNEIKKIWLNESANQEQSTRFFFYFFSFPAINWSEMNFERKMPNFWDKCRTFFSTSRIFSTNLSNERLFQPFQHLLDTLILHNHCFIEQLQHTSWYQNCQFLTSSAIFKCNEENSFTELLQNYVTLIFMFNFEQKIPIFQWSWHLLRKSTYENLESSKNSQLKE